jgi:hypothetical protein
VKARTVTIFWLSVEIRAVDGLEAYPIGLHLRDYIMFYCSAPCSIVLRCILLYCVPTCCIVFYFIGYRCVVLHSILRVLPRALLAAARATDKTPRSFAELTRQQQRPNAGVGRQRAAAGRSPRHPQQRQRGWGCVVAGPLRASFAWIGRMSLKSRFRVN